MGVVHVPHLEPGTFPGEATRTQGGKTPLVRQFGQRIRLVHELAELGRAEKRLDDRGHRPGIHQVVDVDLLGIRVDGHALFDQAGHPGQPDRELIGNELADRADTAIAEVVDVVRGTTPLAQLDEVAEDLDEVFLGEDRDMRRSFQTQPLVDLVAADTAEVVPFRIEEHVLDGGPRGLHIGRVTGPQQRVDGVERLFLTFGGILPEGVLDDRTLSSDLPPGAVDLDLLAASPFQELGHVLIHLRGFLDQHLTRRTVHDHFRQDLPENLFLSLLINRHGTDGARRKEELIDVRIRSETERPQEGRCRELLLLVDVDVADVVDVDAELDPRASEGNDPGTVKLGSVRVDVLLEDHTRRTM